MLQGELIRLRSIEKKDLDQYYNWVNDPELARLILGTIVSYSKEQIIKIYDSYIQSYNNDLLFAIEAIKEEVPVGFCFLRNVHPIHRHGELEQFFIGEKKYRNNGYGKDAIETLLKYCFTELNLNRLWSIIYGYNLAAIQFYEKCGFLKEGTLRQIQFTMGKYHDGVIMAILKEDLENKKFTHERRS